MLHSQAWEAQGGVQEDGVRRGQRSPARAEVVANRAIYMNNNLMILPPMALVVVGLIIWVQRSRNTDLIEEN